MVINKNKELKLIALHIILGFVIFYFKSLAQIYFLLILVYFFFKVLQVKPKDKHITVLLACGYIVGSELLLRMTKGNFFYEISKYSVILFLLIGLFYKGFSRKSFTYILYIACLIPGVFYATMVLDFDVSIRKAIAFNLSGPICLGIAAIYCYNLKLSKQDVLLILRAIFLPIITTTIYVFLFTPDLKDVLRGTTSNVQTSGGFGANQVSTILGLGMICLTIYYYFIKTNNYIKALYLIILALVSYRAIITFSRGGVIVAIICIIVFFAGTMFNKNLKDKKNKLLTIFIFLLIGTSIWIVSSITTFGLIDKRYQNLNASGEEKKDITTGRSTLFMSEFNEFIENPFLGVGVGNMKYKRFKDEGVMSASHNEISRILSEHGFLGLIALLLLLLTPLIFRNSNKKNFIFYMCYIFWFLTINHSSMRIAAPAFIYGLCLLHINYEKPKSKVLQEQKA